MSASIPSSLFADNPTDQGRSSVQTLFKWAPLLHLLKPQCKRTSPTPAEVRSTLLEVRQKLTSGAITEDALLQQLLHAAEVVKTRLPYPLHEAHLLLGACPNAWAPGVALIIAMDADGSLAEAHVAVLDECKYAMGWNLPNSVTLGRIFAMLGKGISPAELEACSQRVQALRVASDAQKKIMELLHWMLKAVERDLLLIPRGEYVCRPAWLRGVCIHTNTHTHTHALAPYTHNTRTHSTHRPTCTTHTHIHTQHTQCLLQGDFSFHLQRFGAWICLLISGRASLLSFNWT